MGRPLEDLTHSGPFAVVLSRGVELEADLRRQYRQVTAGILHRGNLPAWSDLARISRQLAAVERRITDLCAQLERAERREPEMPASGADSASRRARVR